MPVHAGPHAEWCGIVIRHSDGSMLVVELQAEKSCIQWKVKDVVEFSTGTRMFEIEITGEGKRTDTHPETQERPTVVQRAIEGLTNT